MGEPDTTKVPELHLEQCPSAPCNLCDISWLFVVGTNQSGVGGGGGGTGVAAVVNQLAGMDGVQFASNNRDGEARAFADLTMRVQSTNYHSGGVNLETGAGWGNKSIAAASFNAWFHRMVNIKESQCYIQRYFKHMLETSTSTTAQPSSDTTKASALQGIALTETGDLKTVEYLRKTFPCAKIVVDGVGLIAGEYKKMWDFHHHPKNVGFVYMLPQDNSVNSGVEGGSSSGLKVTPEMLQWLGLDGDAASPTAAVTAAAVAEYTTIAQLAMPQDGNGRATVAATEASAIAALHGECNLCEHEYVFVIGTVLVIDRNLHSGMPLVPTPARLKRAYVRLMPFLSGVHTSNRLAL
jgi:hypothetical protein